MTESNRQNRNSVRGTTEMPCTAESGEEKSRSAEKRGFYECMSLSATCKEARFQVRIIGK